MTSNALLIDTAAVITASVSQSNEIIFFTPPSHSPDHSSNRCLPATCRPHCCLGPAQAATLPLLTAGTTTEVGRDPPTHTYQPPPTTYRVM